MSKTSKKIKKRLALAVTAALLALPLGTTLALADTAPVEAASTATSTDSTNTDTTSTDATSTVTTSSETDTANPDISASDTASTDVTNTDDETATNKDADNEDEEEAVVVDADGNEVDPATWLSDLIVKLKMALSSDPIRKSELSEQLALEKLAKAQKLMTEGKTEECQLAFNEYTNKITKAQEFLEQIEKPESEEAKKLTIALTNVNQNNIKVLGDLLEKLPQQAAQRLAVNVVRSMEKAVTKLEKQEAKLAAVTAPETPTPATDAETIPVTATDEKKTPVNVTDKKALEEQAREALKEFKKSLKQKCKIDLDYDDRDQDQDQNRDRDHDQKDYKKNDLVVKQKPTTTNSQPTSVTVAPAKFQPESKTIRTFEQEKRNWNEKDEKSKDRYVDKNHDNHRDDNRRSSDHR